MKRVLAGIGSLLTLGVLLVGIPAALILMAGNPIPSLEQLADFVTYPDWGGGFLLGNLLPCIAWIAWGVFVVPFVLSMPSALNDIRLQRQHPERARSLQKAGPLSPKRSAVFLLGAIIALGGGSQAAMAAPVDQAAPATVSQTVAAAPMTAEAPAEAAPAPAAKAPAASTTKQVTVQDGDSLWKIAEENLGDGEKYPEVFAASTSLEQPGGERLVDPDLIQPGWTVSVPMETAAAPAAAAPAAAAAAEAPAETPAAAPQGASESVQQGDDGAGGAAAVESPEEAPAQAAKEQPVPTATKAPGAAPQAAPKPSPAPAPSSAPAPASTDASAKAAVVEDDGIDSQVLFAGAGIAGLLAAGLVGGVKVKRARQRRVRERGELIAMPEGETAEVEAQLRDVEDPLNESHVDLVCRFLTQWAAVNEITLPGLLAIRLAPEERQISVFLTEPAELEFPVPFVPTSQDGTAWQIQDIDLAGLPLPTAAGAYPALVTLGKDRHGGHILVDVEQWGEISIHGDRELAIAAASAAVLELSRASWADETILHVVGPAISMSDQLTNGHVVRHRDLASVLELLRGRAISTSAELSERGVADVRAARVSEHADSWAPEIVVVPDADDPLMGELRELVTSRPKLGMVSLTVGGESQAKLVIASSSEATFEPIGLSVQPQLVSAHDVEILEEMFAVAEQPAVKPEHEETAAAVVDGETEDAPAAEAAGNTAASDETAELEGTETSVVDAAEVEMDGVARAADLEEDPETPADHQDLVDESTVDVEPEAGADLDADAEGAEDAASNDMTIDPAPMPERPRDVPYVRILGTVEVLPADGVELGTPALGRSIELVAFLALNPNSTSDEYASAFWPNKTSSAASPSMRKLTNVTRNWLGLSAASEPYLPHYSKAEGYRLHDEIRTDWHDFLELVGDDPALASTEALVAALKLVRGQPFAGIKTRFYSWAEGDKEMMIARIADAADELFDRARSSADNVRAQYAATLGQLVAPESEMGWRNLLRIALDQRDGNEFWRQWSRYLEQCEQQGDDFEPGAETQALVDEARELIPA